MVDKFYRVRKNKADSECWEVKVMVYEREVEVKDFRTPYRVHVPVAELWDSVDGREGGGGIKSESI